MMVMMVMMMTTTTMTMTMTMTTTKMMMMMMMMNASPSGHQLAELRIFAGLAVPSASTTTGAAGTHLDGVGGAFGDLHTEPQRVCRC